MKNTLPHVSSETVLVQPQAAPNSKHEPQGGYDPTFFEQLAQIEDRHFWFRARNHLIFELTRKIVSDLPPGYLALEVGCGTGNVLRVLREACSKGTVVGLELWFDGLRYAQRRSAGPLVQGDIRDYPFSKPFNIIGMFDVLEHVQEERETLTSLWNSLTPGGTLLLTVPAHQFLWSYFDEAAHHCRRYSVQGIRHKLTEAGFRIDFISQFMASVFPIVWLVRKIRTLQGKAEHGTIRARASDEFRLVPVVNQVLTGLLTLEMGWIARRHRLPFGTSLVIVARRPA